MDGWVTMNGKINRIALPLICCWTVAFGMDALAAEQVASQEVPGTAALGGTSRAALRAQSRAKEAAEQLITQLLEKTSASDFASAAAKVMGTEPSSRDPTRNDARFLWAKDDVFRKVVAFVDVDRSSPQPSHSPALPVSAVSAGQAPGGKTYVIKVVDFGWVGSATLKLLGEKALGSATVTEFTVAQSPNTSAANPLTLTAKPCKIMGARRAAALIKHPK